MFKRLALLLVVLAAGATPVARAAAPVLGNVWHIPDNSGDLGLNMRSPEFEIGPNTTIRVFQGLQKFGNSYGTANQTGGTLFYKALSAVTWSNVTLSFYTNGGPSANNQYWQASFSTSGIATNDPIQYYFQVNFDGVNGLQTTYLYGGDASSSTTDTQATATNAPFSIRNRAAWLYHSGNRVISAGNDANHSQVDFWIKIGYIGKDGSLGSRWADHASVYYTTDGSTPAGALGVPGGTAQAIALGLDHLENDNSQAGNAMWWKGSATNLPNQTTIKYKLGVWHSANNQEKFADYNAGSNNAVFTFTMGSVGDPVLTVNGLNADYTTTHLFVDEVAGDSIPLTILFSPNVANVTNAEVFSNLNRRDRATQDANGDGIEDGIVPPDGNNIAAGDDNNYYKAYTMAPSGTPGQYTLTLNAQKTGAYRLTARYKVNGNSNWVWYSSSPRRDHALVVAPKKARDISLYELNAMNIGAQGTLDTQRSTFTDLYNGPGSRPYDPVTNRFNLAYAQNLGVNWLWFQPIHPVGVDGRQTDPDTGQPYTVGSPYSVKNFFQINPLLGKANTRAGGMTEFTNFVAAADSAGINVMLDAAFNHSAWDCELDASGVAYFANGSPTTDEIRAHEARVYSRTDAYDMRASSSGNVAPAPDRYDFGKWTDVHDIFFGRYAALVANSSQTTAYLSEADWFDYTVGSEGSSGSGNGHFDGVTRNVWKYFADYVLYWLDKTGCPNGTPAGQTYHGIDGLRADFGQGLPPQCWEYIINKARSRKWDFVFMSESLDGGAVTYRSARHFDILNENIVFPLKSAGSATDYRNIFEDRRKAYGQGLVLLNTTSHDEENYDDPFLAFIRYAVCGTVDGAPMIFYGQELGISRTFGFDQYELNFGKQIPQFKKYNSLQPIFNNRGNGVDFLWPIYAGVNQARGFSKALRSSNRYFLNQTGGGGPQPNIFSVAKFEQPAGSPNFYDVVFGFVNLDRNNTQQGNFDVTATIGGSNYFGIKSGRTYNARNIAAYTGADPNRRNYWLWGGGIAGSTLLSSGMFVGLNRVPGTNSYWASAPFEPQYLKLYDVTAPPTPAAPGTPKAYVLGTNATFSWTAVSDPDGGISGYHVIIGTSPGASNVLNTTVVGTNASVSGTFGTVFYARVSAINNAGIEGPFSPVGAGTLLLDANIVVLGSGPTNGGIVLSWPTVLSNSAMLYSATNLTTPISWKAVPGNPVQTSPQGTLFVPASGTPAQFYRLQLN